MSQTATAPSQPNDPIDITPGVTKQKEQKTSAKGSFLLKTVWLLFIFSGLGIGYYAWQTQLSQQTQAASEIDQLKQDIANLKEAYENILIGQASSGETLSQKVTALEAKMLSVARGTSTTPSPATPHYLHDILTLIALKDIYHKIETGMTFKPDVKILEHTPTPLDIDVKKLAAASTTPFPPLEQLRTGLRVFEDFLEQQKETKPDESLITQMGDFLKIKRSAPAETFVENSEILATAETALELDDVGQATEILKAAFPKPTTEMNEWFRDADKYLEGRDLRASLEGWASQLFAVSESAEG